LSSFKNPAISLLYLWSLLCVSARKLLLGTIISGIEDSVHIEIGFKFSVNCLAKRRGIAKGFVEFGSVIIERFLY
ncbi:2010_t:CDS:1, partial [Gigaspora margarita]